MDCARSKAGKFRKQAKGVAGSLRISCKKKNVDTPLSVTCKCGESVPIPDMITKGYEQTIALLQKQNESLEDDKQALQADNQALQAELSKAMEILQKLTGGVTDVESKLVMEKHRKPGSNVTGMSWEDAQKKAIEYVDASGFPGVEKLSEEVGCSKNTMYKAIKESQLLNNAKREYDSIRKSSKKSHKAVRLTENTLINEEQKKEISPEILTQTKSADREEMLETILKNVPTTNKESAKNEFAKKSDEEIRKIYETFLLDKDNYTRNAQA